MDGSAYENVICLLLLNNWTKNGWGAHASVVCLLGTPVTSLKFEIVSTLCPVRKLPKIEIGNRPSRVIDADVTNDISSRHRVKATCVLARLDLLLEL